MNLNSLPGKRTYLAGKKMLRWLLPFLLLSGVGAAVCAPTDGGRENGLTVLFWNLENFFDWKDGGGGEADREFSAAGPRHWTRKRFRAKAQGVAKTLFWTGDILGDLPDIVAVAEVENETVLRRLLEDTPLRRTDYAYVHFDSPDRRGIDVALLYRTSVLRLAGSRPAAVRAVRAGDTLRTRDILLAQFEDAAGSRWSLLVCHFPSQYGGGDSDWRREAAVARLQALGDSLRACGEDRIIAAGDFNDTPEKPVFRPLTAPSPEALFVNLAGPLARRGSGSIRFEGRWELIDMFFVRPSLAPDAVMDILHPPFLTVHDNVHSGDKPLRTWQGPLWIGGVSDHRPVLLRIRGGKQE